MIEKIVYNRPNPTDRGTKAVFYKFFGELKDSWEEYFLSNTNRLNYAGMCIIKDREHLIFDFRGHYKGLLSAMIILTIGRAARVIYRSPEGQRKSIIGTALRLVEIDCLIEYGYSLNLFHSTRGIL